MKFDGVTIRRTVIAATMILVAACSEHAAENTVAAVEDSELVAGKGLFAACAFCHTTNAGGPSTVGPNLAGILDSNAGSKSDFVYSEALNASGIVWTEEALDSYIESPATFLAGGSMGFVDIADEGERKAVLAYLIEVTNAETAPSVQGEDIAIWE
jgi:cytochrome c